MALSLALGLYINSSTKARLTSAGICESACTRGPAFSTGSAPCKEFPDWNLFIPKQGLSHRGHPVRGIVRWIVFELFHARAEPLVGVVMVVGDARAADVQERETLVA